MADEDTGTAVGVGVVVSLWGALIIAALLRNRAAATRGGPGSSGTSTSTSTSSSGAPSTSTEEQPGLCLTCP